MPSTMNPHVPQIPSRQSGVERDRIVAVRDQPFVDDVEHLEKRHVGGDVLGGVGNELPGLVGASLPPHFQVDTHHL